MIVAPIVVRVASALGVGGGPAVPTFDAPVGVVVVTVVSVVNVPVLEEALFRGYLFGALLSRYDAWIAVLGSGVTFGTVHVFLSGLPGVVEAFVIGVGFALMWYRYDDLAGAGIAHALINAYYVAGLGVLPSLIPG